MDGLVNLLGGFQVALTPENILFAFIGCLIGMLVGVLPGVGQSAGMALLIPITFIMDPTGAVIMLASIYYGAAYGGTITAVLLNIPGESESIVTTFDGYPMACQGRGGIALAISATGSLIGGVVATLCLAVLAQPLAAFAVNLGPPEYFALMVFGLTLAAGLLGNSLAKGLIMVAFGLFLSQVGSDPALGIPRLTFGNFDLYDGIPLLVIIMGFFGLSDMFMNILKPEKAGKATAVGRFVPTRADISRSVGPIGRGSAIGVLLGVLPGMSSALSTFSSYLLERRISRRHRHEFGQGAIEGVAAPETANNAFANASFLPLLTFGIPSSAALAILFAAFTIHGIAPGPAMFTDHPDVAWGLIASMIVGNALLFVLSLPLIRLWLGLLKIPVGWLAAIVIAVSAFGVYSVRNNLLDLLLLATFTLIGCALRATDYPLAPAVLALVLGGKIEASMRQTLVLSRGNLDIFATRPITAALLAAAVTVVALLACSRIAAARRARKQTTSKPQPVASQANRQPDS